MNTTFYRLLICQIVTLFANAALRFALPLYLLRRIDSAALYGSVTALALVPMLLGTLAGGVLADRCRKQKIMAVLDTVSAIGMAAAAVILPAAPESSNGTINISTLATERVSAESRIHGRALPARALVCSIS